MNFITSNNWKLKIANNYASNYNLNFNQINIKLKEIQSEDIIEIAIEKAKSAYNIINKEYIIEESCFSIEKLNGFPGSYTSYIEKTLGLKNIYKILKNLRVKIVEYTSILVFHNGNNNFKIFKARIRGNLIKKFTEGQFFSEIFIPFGFTESLYNLTNDNKKLDLFVRKTSEINSYSKFIKWYLKK
ncbi:MAG: non-canonical purine NTP pyrophosphatase [Candidatus Helarchaeota archaeon]